MCAHPQLRTLNSAVISAPLGANCDWRRRRRRCIPSPFFWQTKIAVSLERIPLAVSRLRAFVFLPYSFTIDHGFAKPVIIKGNSGFRMLGRSMRPQVRLLSGQ